MDTCIENCDVLRYEFILNKPTQALEDMLEQILDELVMRDIIRTKNVSVIKDFFSFYLKKIKFYRSRKKNVPNKVGN